jgi:spore germination protein
VIVLTIYVVKPGDSIYSIAKANGVTPESIISSNQLINPALLVVGQTLVIPSTSRTYTVKSGDTIRSVSRQFGVSQNAIFGANPGIPSSGHLKVGQVITIPSQQQKLGTIEVNGYVFPQSNQAVVSAALSSLTYLSIFSYQINPDGSLPTVNDDAFISLARTNHVAPIMVITNIRATGGFSSDIIHSILTSDSLQQTLIENVLNTMKQKNYYGLNIDFEYIYPADKQNYNNFLTKITNQLHSQGYVVFTAVAPKTSSDQQGILYEAHDYHFHGLTVDRVIIMTYEWGYLAGPPQAVAPLNLVKKVVEYALTEIPAKKILMGIPNYGYDWVLPYTPGTLATTFSNIEAVNRAYQNNADIHYDETAQSPYYNYYDSQKRQHIVWFEDARSIQQKLLLVSKYGLAGASYWTMERAFPQNLLVLNSMFDIKKVI